MNRFSAGAMAASAFLGSVALAQDDASGRVLSGLARCRGVAEPDARLACFDQAAAALDAAVKSKEVAIVDRQEVRRARRSLFGFTLPRIGLFGGDGPGGEQPEPAELNTTLAGVRQLANGRVELRLAEGDAVWATTDPMPFPPKAGSKIRIRKGALGNYFLAIQGARSVRGVRVR